MTQTKPEADFAPGFEPQTAGPSDEAVRKLLMGLAATGRCVGQPRIEFYSNNQAVGEGFVIVPPEIPGGRGLAFLFGFFPFRPPSTEQPADRQGPGLDPATIRLFEFETRDDLPIQFNIVAGTPESGLALAPMRESVTAAYAGATVALGQVDYAAWAEGSPGARQRLSALSE